MCQKCLSPAWCWTLCENRWFRLWICARAELQTRVLTETRRESWKNLGRELRQRFNLFAKRRKSAPFPTQAQQKFTNNNTVYIFVGTNTINTILGLLVRVGCGHATACTHKDAEQMQHLHGKHTDSTRHTRHTMPAMSSTPCIPFISIHDIHADQKDHSNHICSAYLNYPRSIPTSNAT